MAEYLPTNDGRPLKTIDALLDDLYRVMGERDIARIELAEERVAHRVTKKELAETVGMVLR